MSEIQELVCQKHGPYTGEEQTLSFCGNSITMKPICPECDKELVEQKRIEEEEAKKRRIISIWQSMNIDPKFHDSTFENFNAYNDELHENLQKCRDFAEHPNGKIVMLGENGNGKTHLSVSILKKTGGVIYKAFEIGINLRATIGGNTMEASVYEELCRVPLLVIDEVEKIKDSEAKQNWMSYVIGKRYDRMLPIILIANCHTKKDCQEKVRPCPKCLEYHLENDVLSRIIEDGIILKFNSPDYRKKIREMKLGKRRQ